MVLRPGESPRAIIEIKTVDSLACHYQKVLISIIINVAPSG